MQETYILIAALALGGLAGRELWLHMQIIRLQRDISWIVRWINGEGPHKGG